MAENRLALLLCKEHMNDVLQALMLALGTIIQNQGPGRSPSEWIDFYDQEVNAYLNEGEVRRITASTVPPPIGGREREEKLASTINAALESLSAHDAILNLAELTVEWMHLVPAALVLDFAAFVGSNLDKNDISESALMRYLTKCLAMALEVGR